jgi:hypothetical protein
MDAAIQKYAQFGRCKGICVSDQVEIDQIFDGLLLAPEFAVVRDGIKQQPAFDERAKDSLDRWHTNVSATREVRSQSGWRSR